MPAQRDLAHANIEDADMILIIHVGNAHIGISTVSVNGLFIPDNQGNPKQFEHSFQVNLGKAADLLKKDIQVKSEIAPNPAIPDKTLLFTYDLTNARFFTGKNRTLISSEYNGSDSFRVTITII